MSLIDLYISDGGSIRRIGDNCHDMLTIEDGKLCYYNLQNGDGCRLGEDSEWYSFVENVDEYGYNCDPRKTENSSEKPNNCEECKHWNDTEDGCADRHECRATTEDWQDWKDKMWSEAVVTEPTTEDCSTVPTCSVNGRPYDCGNCEYHKCTADEPQK